MNPPYDITPDILTLITRLSEKIGEVNANFLIKPSPTLRKQNRIKTIHSSLKIEGNTLTEKQITELIDNKRVISSEKGHLVGMNQLKSMMSDDDLPFKDNLVVNLGDCAYSAENAVQEVSDELQKNLVLWIRIASLLHKKPSITICLSMQRLNFHQAYPAVEECPLV